MENRILNDRKLNQGERKKLIQDLYKISKAVNESISTDFANLSIDRRKLITVEYIDPFNDKLKGFDLSYKEALSESRNIARRIMDYASGKKIEKNTKIKQVTNKQVNTNNTSNVKLDYGLNSIIKTTKKHPCGNDEWEIIRMGADIKIKCTKCNRIIMLSRRNFNKRLKQVVK